jgi:outer membrane protein TolC
MKKIIEQPLVMSALFRKKSNNMLMLPVALSFAFPTLNIATASESITVPLSFYQAVKRAQKNDPWLMGNKHQQSAVESKSWFASTLSDPKISVGFANVAADSFEFDQESMSQFKVGITQMFPRGDSLSIKQRQLIIQSEAFPFQRQDRQAKVAVTVGSLWLNMYEVQQSMILIERNRLLFAQLVDITQASYSSSREKTRQQDIVRAQLEVSRIEDQLLQLNQKQQQFSGQLNAWLATDISSETRLLSIDRIENELPEIARQGSQTGLINAISDSEKFGVLAHVFSQHPALAAIDKTIKSTAVGTELAQQKYKPAWGVTASYALRDSDPMGNDRADLFSVGVVFELPIFTDNRQDQEVKATISKTEAVKTDKQLLLRRFYSSYASSHGRLQQLVKRKVLFDEKLRPQFHQQAEITLNAYTHDSGDFSEVVRAKIDELNAEIDYLSITVEQKKLQLALNYLFVKAHFRKSHSPIQKQGGL